MYMFVVAIITVSKINDDSYNVVTMTRARSHRTQVRDTSIVTPGGCVTSSGSLSRVKVKNLDGLES